MIKFALASVATGDEVEVTDLELEKLAEPITVFNLEVEDFHTYFVGEYGVLVHNKYHKHHSDPKYLGGNPKQPLTDVPDSVHYKIHAAIDKVFPRQKGKAYYNELVKNDPKYNDKIKETLEKIYKEFSNECPTLLEDFAKNFKNR